MEQSDFLELNLPSSSDYAGHWDVPLNGSLTMIDDECKEIATELLADPVDGYIGQLKRTHASLEARLDSIENPNAPGGLMFNNDTNNISDLEHSRTSRKPWTGIANNIHTRIEKCEETEYVEDAIKGSLATGLGGVPYAKNRMDRLSGTQVKARRYSSGAAVDLESFYFRNILASSMITHSGVNELTVGALGLMQIGGNLYHHTRTGTVPVIDAGLHTYRVSAVASDATSELDCQLIRTSLSAGCCAGTFTAGGSTFTANDLVKIDDADVGNNHWKPQAGQILRISYSGGAYYDYQIKTVPAGIGSIEIFGKFEVDGSVGSYDWEIYDLTQPCINVTEVLAVDVTADAACYTWDKTVTELLLAIVHVDNGNIRVTAPVQTGYLSKTILLYPTFDATGHIGTGTMDEIVLNDVSVANIKDIKVITVERIWENVAPDVYHYVTSINPKRLVTIGGQDFFLDSFHVTHYGTIESDTGDQIVNYGTIGPDAFGTVIRLVHPDYGDDAAVNSYWSYDPSMVACPLDGYALMFVGILVELN